MIRIAVGSKNPAKIAAVQLAFERMWPNEQIVCIGVATESDVADQPLNDAETLQGAKNRAQKAREQQTCDYSVGLEGGLSPLGGRWLTGNIAVVIDKKDNVGIGMSTRVAIPQEVYDHVQQGQELSHAIKTVYGHHDIGKKDGALGLLSNGLITRASASSEAVIAAISSLPKTITVEWYASKP